MNINAFIPFDPTKDDPKKIPEKPGNYIVVVRDFMSFPDLGHDLACKIFNDMDIIYTGVAGSSLHTRIWKNHFGGNAGHSTLRLSLGCLFGYGLIQRDKKDPNNGHVRFEAEDEKKLTAWMKENLVFYYFPNEMPEIGEAELIDRLNPPLNLMKNENDENLEFRMDLSELRRRKPWLTEMEPSFREPDFSTPFSRVFRIDIHDYALGWEDISLQFDHNTIRFNVCDAGPEPLTSLIHAIINFTQSPADDFYDVVWTMEDAEVSVVLHRDGDAVLFCFGWDIMDEEGERQHNDFQFKVHLGDLIHEVKEQSAELLRRYGIIGFGANWSGYRDTYDEFPLASLLKIHGAKLLYADEAPFPCSNLIEEIDLLKQILGKR